MLTDFNLLVSTTRGREDKACSEIRCLLDEMEDKGAWTEKTSFPGLATAKTNLDPFEVVKKLRERLKKRPWDIRYTLKVVPIERIVSTDLKEIGRVCTELSSKISKAERFRITVEKRHTDLSTMSIIEAAAAKIERRVDLDNPDKIVLVEVLGGLTGVSVVKPKDILSVEVEKRSL